MSSKTSEVTRHCNPALLQAGASIAARKLAAFEDDRSPVTELGDGEALDLYEGPWGSAFFWGAMSVCAQADREQWRQRCFNWLTLLRDRLRTWREQPESAAPEAPLGVFHGLGAPIYTLSVLGGLLQQNELIEEAESVARMMTAERISRDRHFDVVEGCAGAILALLVLDDALGRMGCSPSDPRRLGPRSTAVQCGEHLLTHLQEHRPGAAAWPAPHSGHLQSGFGHGAAGIHFALTQLAAVRPRPDLASALEVSRQLVDDLYLPSKRRWLPFPGFDPAGPLMTAWCWGAPGIALSLLPSTETPSSARHQAALEQAIAITAEMGDTREDFLCCGNLGRAMILDYVHRASSSEPEQASPHPSADKIAFNVLRRLKKRGDFGWPMEGEETPFAPSLFKGAAGVGYAFLYLAEPQRLPMILCGESLPT